MDLAVSAADAAEYFKDQKGPEVEKLFWSQFHAPVRPLLLNEQLTGWAALHRLSGLSMRSIVVKLRGVVGSLQLSYGDCPNLVCKGSVAVGVKTGGSRVGGPDLCVLG